MHALSILSFTLLTLVAAKPVKRDLATVEAAFANITTALDWLDTDVNALTANSDVTTAV